METFLRAQFDLLQYGAFFGALAVLGGLEFLLPLRPWQRNRLWRWPANAGLTILNIFLLSVLPLSGLAAADWAVTQGIGVLPQLGVGGWLLLVLGVLLRSLTNYGVHFAMHKIPVLWRLHRVHHSDTELDVSSAVRFHPLEFAVQVPVSLATIVAFGVPPVAIILYELLDAFMAVWTHANIRLPLGVERIIGTILVTPSMHRIHHSSHWLETDSNYGATLSIWDRLFRTLRDKSHAEQAGMELGLEECQDARSRNFLWLLILPFIRLLALRKREGQ